MHLSSYMASYVDHSSIFEHEKRALQEKEGEDVEDGDIDVANEDIEGADGVDEVEQHSIGRLSEVSYNSGDSQTDTKAAYEFGDENVNI